jgi:hypothetical protein
VWVRGLSPLYNNRRLHSRLDYVPPDEHEAAYYPHIQRVWPDGSRPLGIRCGRGSSALRRCPRSTGFTWIQGTPSAPQDVPRLNRFHMYSGDTQPYSFLELLGDLRVVLLQGNDAVGAQMRILKREWSPSAAGCVFPLHRHHLPRI